MVASLVYSSENDKYRSPHARTKGMTLTMIGVAMSVIDTTIANTALPTIAESLHVSFGACVWVIASYQIVVCALLLPCSVLSRRLGSRKVFLVGSLLFSLASFACSVTHSLAVLTFARAIQGCGAAGIMSVSMALIKAMYPPEHLGRAMGFNAQVVAISALIGPPAASGIISVLGWPWIFGINVPFGLFIVLFGNKWLPDTQISTERYFGVVHMGLFAFAVGMLSLVVLLPSATLLQNLILVGMSVLAGTAFFIRDRGFARPLFPYSLYADRVIALASLNSVCSFAMQASAFVALPFLLVERMNESIGLSGTVIAVWPATIAVFAPFIGRLSDRYSSAILCKYGMILLGLGFSILVFVSTILNAISSYAALSTILFALFVCGAGFSLFQAPNLREIMSRAPIKMSADASGIVAMSRVAGQLVGVLVAAFTYRTFSGYATNIIFFFAVLLALVGFVISQKREHMS